MTGTDFLDALSDACTRLETYCDTLNAINVFPVADGDTGSNMLRTLSAVRGIVHVPQIPLCEAADSAASAILRAARGNSGIILALLFRGMAQRLCKVYTADGTIFAEALLAASDFARENVPQPREGTILTVAAAAAKEALAAGDALPVVLSAACAGALSGLEQTPQMLPVLHESGTVDAGGFGYLLILQAFAERFGGSYAVRTFSVSAAKPDTAHYRYCTELLIEQYTPGDVPEALHTFLTSCGDCGNAVASDGTVKVHVHTNEPWHVLRQALVYGTVHDLKVDNMQMQMTKGVRGWN